MPHPILDIVARTATSTHVYTLASISSVRKWDYSLPTLTKDKRFTERKPRTSSSSFKSAFHERYHNLKEINLDYLALMGGAVLSLLLTDAFTSNYLDFFVVTDRVLQRSLSNDAMAAFSHDRVKQFIHDVYTPEFKLAADRFYQLELFNVYTIKGPTLHTDEQSESECHTIVSKFPTRHFAFGVDEVIDLPQLTIVVNQLKDYKVGVTELKKPNQNDVDATPSPFDEYNKASSTNSMHADAIIHHKIICLINRDYNGFIVAGDGANYAQAFRDRPDITERMVIQMYETVKTDLYINSTLNLNKLAKYFTVLKRHRAIVL
ncbi:Aste57867_10613 [Aphanomyces stellatus]|uniref:Aste57867_10613 protein n=1 Tax=Aphanomyces stellatus TaxID=120398 RepID=A0A485KRB9_9STRA|nr:hypothetical protein As57867_010573 [Aphanomyces stellatus]VFT87485.1 Aste57867_10613 [Aphanomyces stellatus]